jgi:enoyl-CoA hydratase/carnithine racemase
VTLAVSDHVGTITLNRPAQMNPLSLGMQRDLDSALKHAAQDPEVRVVVLTGAGDKAFSAGADLQALNNDGGELDKYFSRELFRDLLMSTQQLGKPLIGRINGHAMAGGFGLTCVCDMLVAAESATFGTPEINVGLWPMMLQALMIRNLPRKFVMRMLLLGERFSAQQMQQVGYVSEVVPLAQLDDAVAEFTGKLVKKSPMVLRLGRDAFFRQQDMELSAALAYLHTSLSLVSLSEDAREGIAAFVEKRPAQFTGR